MSVRIDFGKQIFDLFSREVKSSFWYTPHVRDISYYVCATRLEEWYLFHIRCSKNSDEGTMLFTIEISFILVGYFSQQLLHSCIDECKKGEYKKPQ